jgi:triacylglycerol lipase
MVLGPPMIDAVALEARRMITKKPIEPQNIAWLTPPNDDAHPPAYHFFEHPPAFEFRDDATGMELTNASWLADASLLAYSDPAVIERAFSSLRSTMRIHHVAADSTQGYIAADDRKVIVAFRGTQVPKPRPGSLTDLFDPRWIPDWITDVKTDVVDEAGGRVHRGFRDALARVWSTVESHLDRLAGEVPDRSFWFTGHSLGAALATLAANRLSAKRPDRRVALYTFGSPRVGDREFRRNFTVSQAFRFVHRHDLVPTVPHIACHVSTGSLGSFAHVGQRVNVTSNGIELAEQTSTSDGLNDEGAGVLIADFARRMKLELTSASVRERIADHAPTYYASLLWNAL